MDLKILIYIYLVYVLHNENDCIQKESFGGILIFCGWEMVLPFTKTSHESSAPYVSQTSEDIISQSSNFYESENCGA